MIVNPQITTIYHLSLYPYHIILKFTCNPMLKNFITKDGLKELDNYKYKPGGSTWLDGVMNPFWEWTVTLVPKTIAPNMITFIGWLLIIASYANMLRYDYTFQKDLPRWPFFFTAICVFIYMTLDAIDGKQARRTGSSSPLGQLFDHGCDSFSISFLVLGVCQAVKFEVQQVFLVFLVCQLSFFVSNWSEYNTGILKTKIGQFGVTEAEYSVIFFHLVTGIFGQDFWSIKLQSLLPFVVQKSSPILFNLSLMKVSSIIVYPYAAILLSMNLYMIIGTIFSSKQKLKVASQFLTIVILMCLEVAWSKMKIYDHYCGFILLNFGIVQSFLICKLIVCSVTKMNFAAFHAQLVPLMVTSVLLFVLEFLKVKKHTLSLVFYLSFIINVLMSIVFLYFTIKQITEYLGIYCFSIEKRRRKTQ